MNKEQSDYQKLVNLSREARIMKGISSHLTWDQETYMPSAGAGIRADQLELLAGKIHELETSSKFSDALQKLIDIKSGKIIRKDLSENEIASLKLWRKDYLKAIRLPKSFVEEFTKVCAQSVGVWQIAKQENAFQKFAPFLERIIHLTRQKADYLGFEEHPYDALLNEYEPEMKTSQVDLLFSQVKKTLIPLIEKIAPKNVEDHFLFGDWDHGKQLAFGHTLLENVGYDFSRGRIDISSHPFSSASHPSDSRITTRIHPECLMSNIFVLLHEAGHAMYEMGLPEEEYGTPLGDYLSLGMHEGQSRWWETRIGMSEPFWHYYFPLLKDTFKGKLEAVTFDRFYHAINKVKPSLIRVEADELTYPLHVILRFELEKEFIQGNLSVRDLPDAWNAKMEASFGLTPPTNREGCLQDIHWAWGSFGYFPTYSLGNMYAAHLFETFEKDQENWKERVSSGELKFIKSWLHDKIHRHGRRYSAEELMKEATGKKFSVDPYLSYLKNKYEALYKI